MKLALVIGLGLSASAAMGDVDLVAQGRYIQENGFETTPVGVVPYTHVDTAPGFDTFNSTFDYASQNSAINTAFIHGYGMASGLPGSPMNPHPFTGRSYMTVVFSVAVDQPYTLTGSLTGSNANPISTVSSFLSLTGPGVAIDRRSYLEPGTFLYSGTLAPGEYTLTCDARVDEFEGSFVQPASWYFWFRTVPSPSAMALFAGAGLMATRRRR